MDDSFRSGLVDQLPKDKKISDDSVTAELDAFRSVIEQSKRVLERLQKKAKELNDKDFMLPKAKTNLCLDQKNACKQCFNENTLDTLKCETVAERFVECARRVRQQMNSQANLEAGNSFKDI